MKTSVVRKHLERAEQEPGSAAAPRARTVEGPAPRVTVREVNGRGKFQIKKLPGRQKAGEITLTRGLTADNSFEKWVESSRFGKMGEARKGGAIIVFDYEGTALKRYKLANAWPKSLEIGSLKAGDTSVLTEKLTVTYEEMEVE